MFKFRHLRYFIFPTIALLYCPTGHSQVNYEEFFGPCVAKEESLLLRYKSTLEKSLAYAIKQIDLNDPGAIKTIDKWLGDSSISTRQLVLSNFRSAQVTAKLIQHRCQNKVPTSKAVAHELKNDLTAFVYKSDNARNVYFTSEFFVSKPNSGLETKWGFIAHEVLHFYFAGAGLTDTCLPNLSTSKCVKVYGPKLAKSLVAISPKKASMNTDNYVFILEEIASTRPGQYSRSP